MKLIRSYILINKDLNTSVYVKFSKNTYEYMRKYSEFVGSSISDFVRQSVMERIIKLGALNLEVQKNEKIN